MRPSAPTITFTCSTLSPSVRDAGSLSRTARSAKPLVDRRMFRIRSAKTRNTAERKVGESQVTAREARAVEGHPEPALQEAVRVKTSVSTEQPEGQRHQRDVEVAEPDREHADDGPATAATTPAEDRSPASTGTCQTVANWAAASAPPPAKMICESQSMPPSPVTTVKVRNVMRVAQAQCDQSEPERADPWKISGSSATTIIGTAPNDAALPGRDRELRSATLPGSSVAGRIAWSSGPPAPAPSSDDAGRTRR